MNVRSSASPIAVVAVVIEEIRGQRQPQRRVDMQASERIAGVVEVDVDPRPLALSRGKNGVDVEKREAERLKTEQSQGTKIKRARPAVP
jgi:hypothetical protein